MLLWYHLHAEGVAQLDLGSGKYIVSYLRHGKSCGWCRFIHSDRSLRDGAVCISFHTYGMENHGGWCRFLHSDRSLWDGAVCIYRFIPMAWKIMVGGIVFYIAIDPFGMVRYVYHFIPTAWKIMWVVSFST